MYALDFEYDGQYLSDFGMVICDFNPPSGADVQEIGSVITFNTVPRHSGKKWGLTSTQYEECIQATFDICKNPDLFDPMDMEISDDEYRNLMRWLNRREFLKFRVFGEEGGGADDYFYNASFNVSKIKIREILYGLELTMETDRPFGFFVDSIVPLDFSDTSKSYVINNISEEIGFIYPSLKITCQSGGDLSLKNETYNRTMEVKNCSAGEVITVDGDTMQISSSHTHKNLPNDFNYSFFVLGNSYHDRANKISATLPCKVELNYTPIVKNMP